MMPAQFRLIAAAILLALAGAGLWYLHHDGYEAGRTEVEAAWESDKLKQARAQQAALIAYAEKIRQAEDQHDQDQNTIDSLAADARRLRIHLPACPGAQGGPDQNGAAGAFSAGVDQRFREFQERVGSLVARCDQLNIDAIRVNKSR